MIASVLHRLALGAIAWNLAGYPALAAVVGAVRRRRPRADPAHLPPLTVLVAAHDEADGIAARVEDILAQDYPDLEVIVIDDGSTDSTAARAAAAGARVIRQARAGKVTALARGVAAARGEILVVTDANTRFAPGALRALAAALADPEVGVACGDLRYERTGETDAARGEAAYWSVETALKRAESDAGWMLMGAGAIYAVRRADWPAIPADLADDSYVPLSAIASGKRVVFVPEAVATEPVGATIGEEMRRRVRMVAQDARVVARWWPRLGDPEVRLALASHKVLRWLLLPLAGVALAAGVAAGARTALLPGAFFAAAGAGAALRAAGRPVPRPLGHALYALAATAAAAAGLGRALLGRSDATWAVAPSTRRGRTA